MTDLSVSEIMDLYSDDNSQSLYNEARKTTVKYHGKKIILRGLVEFTNKCTVNCEYCGIRRGNTKVHRYNLSRKTIVETCVHGFNKGLRTFVLQGGEDPSISAHDICKTVEEIKEKTHGEAAITLSFGARSLGEYRDMRKSGVDRYLLRFETSDATLYYKLRGLKLRDRLKNLEDIRNAGLQVGSGYMTGLPGENNKIRKDNALLCKDLELNMLGIGPFIPSGDTPLENAPQESIEYAIKGTALLRLFLPKAHIPATTAAGSLKPTGREDMIMAGANVLMPNITPEDAKKDYLLYPGKICLNESGYQFIDDIKKKLKGIDREIDFSRGDALGFYDV